MISANFSLSLAKKQTITTLLFWSILPIVSPAFALEEVEFDSNFLQQVEGQKTIDVARFSSGNSIAAGDYRDVDLYLNQQWRGKFTLTAIDIDNKSTICLTPELFDLMDVKDEAIADKQTIEDKCIPFAAAIPSATVNFDVAHLRLNVELPQAYLVQRPRGYISPAQWQNGVPVAFVRYDANYYQFQSAENTVSQSYLGLFAGINLGNWALRHRGSITWVNQQSQGYNNIENYLQHDVAALRAQFMLGDFTTSGDVMDSLPFRGVSLTSDDAMLPSSVRGYAPVIQGVANSNAKVTVKQNGNIIFETTVPAGPFSIDQLYPTGYSDDLIVEVMEANGQTRTFTVPLSSMSRLIRPGYSRYAVAAGYYRHNKKTFDQPIVQLSWQYGLNNHLTLLSGATLSKDYQSVKLGATIGTVLGNLTTEITQNRTNFRQSQRSYQAQRLRLIYNKNFSETNTYLYLSASRYFSPHFYQLSDVLSANEEYPRDQVDFLLANQQTKAQFQISLNQVLPQNWGSLYISGSSYHYWNATKPSNQYQVGYHNFWKRLNYQINFSQSRDYYSGRKDNQWSLNFSMPLGENQNTAQLAVATTHNAGTTGEQLSLSGALGQYNQYSYNLSTQRHNDISSYAIYGGYRSGFSNLNASYSRDNQQNRQYSISSNGAVVAHPYGITLSNELGHTFAIIHADGASGAEIENNWGSKLDYFGNGIVPYLTPYQFNQISINPSNLPIDVDLDATSKQIIPRANSAMLIKFITQSGRIVFFDLELENGGVPPMAAEAFDQNNQPIGTVVQGGRLYSRNIADKGAITVVWGTDQQNRCQFKYQISEQDQPAQSHLPIIKNAICRINADQ